MVNALQKVVLGDASKRRSFIHTVAQAQRLHDPERAGNFTLDTVVGAADESAEAQDGLGARWKKVRNKRKELRLCMAKDRLKTMALYENLGPHVQAELLDIVNYSGVVPRGTVLFKQSDIPGQDDSGDVFIVVSGEVAVWMRQHVDESPVADFPDPDEFQPGSPTSVGRRSAGRRGGAASPLSPASPGGKRLDAKQLILAAQQAAAGIEPTSNSEGHGVQVSSIGPGMFLGHTALLHQEPRNATCITALDCELLVIPRLDFERVLKPAFANIKDEKEVFLTAHVPGLGQMTEPELVLPNFAQLFYKKGHVFWQQGLTVEVPVMYVLLKGVVEVRHRRRADEPERVISTLMPGAFFGTCSGQPEPFTVCASSKHACDIYEARDNEFRRMPVLVRRAAEEHLHKTNSLHLQRTWPSEDALLGTRKKEWWEESEGAQHVFGPKRSSRLGTPCSRSGSRGNGGGTQERRKAAAPAAQRHQLQEASQELAQSPWKTPKETALKGSWKGWTNHGRAHIQQLIFEDMAPIAVEGRLPEYKELSGWMKRVERVGPPSSQPSRMDGSMMSSMRSVMLTSSTMSTSTMDSLRPASSSSCSRPAGARGLRKVCRPGALGASDGSLPSALVSGVSGAGFAQQTVHASPPFRATSTSAQAWKA